MPIDPNEAPEGYVAVEETGASDGCDGCAFSRDKMCLDRACYAGARNDRCNVIFVPESAYMKTQKFTPKYWICHDKTTDDPELGD